LDVDILDGLDLNAFAKTNSNLSKLWSHQNLFSEREKNIIFANLLNGLIVQGIE
jgi:hypothetical protein